jgi:hypothetical protein
MVSYEYAPLRSTEAPATIALPDGWKWSQMGPGNADRADNGHPLFLNATGLVANLCHHKYVYARKYTDDVHIYHHVNMLFPAIVVRKVPMQNAVLQVDVSIKSGEPFAADSKKRHASIVITCATLGGNTVFTGWFKDAPLKTLHFREKVQRAMMDSGHCSGNSQLHFVLQGATKTLRGNALVWKGSTKGKKTGKVVGRQTSMKQLTLK